MILYPKAKKVLRSFYVLDGFFRMNPKNPEMAKKAILSAIRKIDMTTMPDYIVLFSARLWYNIIV